MRSGWSWRGAAVDHDANEVRYDAKLLDDACHRGKNVGSGPTRLLLDNGAVVQDRGSRTLAIRPYGYPKPRKGEFDGGALGFFR